MKCDAAADVKSQLAKMILFTLCESECDSALPCVPPDAVVLNMCAGIQTAGLFKLEKGSVAVFK